MWLPVLSKIQKASSNLSDVKKCKLHGIFFMGLCPLCNEEGNNSEVKNW